MSEAGTSLFLVEQYDVGVSSPGLVLLSSALGTRWWWGVHLVDESTSLAVVEAPDLATLLEGARTAAVDLHHVSRARLLR
ncbi:MAG: hypothetical protein MUE78_04440 [Ilumatobacteraceae bacterium]|nr:hypothetical protein [Ilumatobacteraceae bacterium]